MSKQDPVIAKPSDVCCIKGSLHEGEPRGRFERLAEVDTYIATPAEGKANGHILLYFPDVWGFFNNGFLVMDGFADSGFLTLGLDYFRGVGAFEDWYRAVVELTHIRIPSGNTERIDLILRPSPISIMKRGKQSIKPLPPSMFRSGCLPSRRNMANPPRSLLVSGILAHFG